MYVVFIGIIIILLIKNDQLKKELFNSKEENKMLHINIFNMANRLNSMLNQGQEKNIELKNQETNRNITSQNTNQHISFPKEPIYQETKTIPKNTFSKNSLILVLGATFIVLAALVFLTSNWTVLPNIFKTLILFCLILVFLGMYKLADEKFKLPKTSLTFFYIAMFYIPIFWYSLSYLKLLGNYLSIGSNGSFLYLSLTSIITSIIYLKVNVKSDKKHLTTANYFFQIFAVIFFALFLKCNFFGVVLLLTIYNLAILIKNIYFKESVISNNVFLIERIALIVTLIISLFITAFESPSIELLLTNILLIVITCIKKKQTKEMNETIILQILTVGLSLAIAQFIPESEKIILMMLIGAIISYLIFSFLPKEKDIKSSLVPAISLGLIYIIALNNMSEQIIFLLIVAASLMLAISEYYKHRKSIPATFVPLTLMLFIIHLSFYLDIEYIGFITLLVIIEIIKVLLNYYLEKEEKLLVPFEIITNTITLSNLMFFFIIEIFIGETKAILIPVIMSITSYLNYYKTKKTYHSVIGTISLGAIYLTFMNILKQQECKSIAYLIVTPIVLLLNTKGKDIESTKTPTILSFILGFCFLLFNEITLTTIILTTLLATLFIKYNQIKYKKNNLNYIAYFFLALNLYNSPMLKVANIYITPFISFIFIFILLIKIFLEKEDNIETTIISFIYIILDYLAFESNIYYILILLISWSLVNLLSTKKYKVIYLISCNFSLLLLYQNLITDLNLDEITAIKLFGLLLFTILTTRSTIYKKNHKLAKIIETVIIIISCLAALNSYQSQTDGMIFVTLLVAIVIICYKLKISTYFFVSIIAILINLFLLTIELWFSIPWWIYLLVIGIILIIFATNNELQENMKKEHVKSKIKKITDYFEQEVL